MSVTHLRNATMSDASRELKRMLSEGIRSINVRRLAESAVTDNQIADVFDFMKAKFKYQPDPLGVELFIHPNRVAEDYFAGNLRRMDCDDMALTSGAMLGSLGNRVRIIIADTAFNGEYDHAWSEIYSEKLNGWISCDPSSSLPLGWCIEYGKRIVVIPN